MKQLVTAIDGELMTVRPSGGHHHISLLTTCLSFAGLMAIQVFLFPEKTLTQRLISESKAQNNAFGVIVITL